MRQCNALALYRTEDGEKFELIAAPDFKGPMMQITDVMHIHGRGMMCFWFGGSYGDDMNLRHWGVIESADNGRILAIARVEDRGNPQFQLTSTDYGETWKVRKTNIFDVRGSTPSLIYDPKTRIISYYYYYYYQRVSGILA